ADHNVGKMYVRFFDIVLDNATAKSKPNATLNLVDEHSPFPAGVEIIPTVFIVNDCFAADTAAMAERVVKRVLQMCETHSIANVNEIQIDCDWTAKTQSAYFAFLEAVKHELGERNMKLSVTIRLHQLTMDVPPAHYGVLMMYNTGDARDYNIKNPILDYAQVKPYIKNAKNYDLPLCVAYPNFSWNLLFKGKEFKAILYDADLTDSTLYRRVDDYHYVAVAHRDMPMSANDTDFGVVVNPGDSVLVREVPLSTIVKIHDELSAMREGINDQVIIYDLNSKNLNRYNHEDYEKIFLP
ncbi:MAG: hypothetical protein IK092_03825, partial [Muribaculaceae bacterium]|nr:hypothetical protein [Muribaculaceae bacterium]